MIYRILIWILNRLRGITREQFDAAVALVNAAQKAMSGKSGAEKRAYVTTALKEAFTKLPDSTVNWLIETALAWVKKKAA